MLFRTCWRCLSRLPVRKLPLYSITPQKIAAFTTSPSLGASKDKLPEKARVGIKKLPPQRGTKNFRLKKKIIASEKGKRPLPGERKAARKRVVLINSNALVVEGMQDATTEFLVDVQSRGQMIGIPGPIVDQLRAVDAFKPTQSWSLFRRPATLIREQTVRYAKLFEELSEDGVTRRVQRVLTGERGSGKTVMLLQAMTIAFLKNWVVINLPDGMTLMAIKLPSAS
ncbi:37S ribosomal protein S23 mitochondrial [Sticta canariensis]|nr:37S ribosomal protein S23 mitochondrial [Sticta canariensis]